MYKEYNEDGRFIREKEDLNSLEEDVLEFGGYVLEEDKLVYMVSGFDHITRRQALEYLYRKVPEMVKKGIYNGYDCWGFCSCFNSAHPDEEIFMCEHCDDDYHVDGVYVEDDYWLYE